MTDKIQKLFNDTILYFKKLSKQYRNSGELNKSFKWLLKEITKIGLKIEFDDFSDNSPFSKNKYGNIMFDIPSNDKNLNSIILQAHYDMVVVSDDWNKTRKNGIQIVDEIVEDKRIIHSKNYKTSLGADNGVGVSLILSLAKNSNLFKHGNIRCILTADEEIPHGGSKQKSIRKWLIYDKLINLDTSFANTARIGCFSCQEVGFEKTTKRSSNKKQHQYTIVISDLKGGHSAGFEETQTNANKLMFDFLSKLKDVQIISFNNLNNNKTNAISVSAKITFSTNLSEKEINDIWSKQNYSKKYPLDNKLNIKVIKNKNISNFALSVYDSQTLINFINDTFCGVIEKDKNNNPISTANIGPLNSFDCSDEKVKISLLSLIRSGKKSFKNKTDKKINELKNKYKFNIFYDHYNKVWKAKKNSKLQKLLLKASRQAGYPICFDITTAWLEPSDFSYLKPELDIVSTGSNLKYCHTNKETWYVDSLEPLIQRLLLVFELDKKH